MENLNLDRLKSTIEAFKTTPIPVGLVVKSSLKEKILGSISTRKDNQCNFFGGLPIYFDDDQKEDCLVFEDADLLNIYLNRKKHPESWIKELVNRLPNQKIFDESLAIPPTIPQLKDSHWFFTNYWKG